MPSAPIDAHTKQPRRLLQHLLLPIVLAACAILLHSPSAARDTSLPASAQLEALNADFRALYHQRTQQVLEALPLVLVVQNHTITAVRGNHRHLYPVPLQRYNEARAIVHTVLGFNGLMGSLAQSETPAGQTNEANVSTKETARAQLPAFQQSLKHVRQTIADTTLTRPEKAHAQTVLALLDNATREAMSNKTVTRQWIEGMLRQTEAPLTSLTESVGRAHADAMLKTLARIQADAEPQEWAQAVAVVTGPMTPRRNNLETAVVASVLGQEHLGTRIFYSENIFDVDGALAYLRTLVGDQELSLNVFGKPHRMWEDLFAPVSATLVEGEFYTELPR